MKSDPMSYLKAQREGMSPKEALEIGKKHGNAELANHTFPIHTPRVYAVKQVNPPSNEGCTKCLGKSWGTLGMCKKHTPIVSIAHMGFWRWLWVHVSLQVYSPSVIIEATKIALKKALKYVLLAIIIIEILYLAGSVLLTGLDRSAVAHCNNLVDQSTQGLIGYYVTKNDHDMCASYNIQIDAPIGSAHEQ